MSLIVGTAGWSIPANDAGSFIKKGSLLERYASRFPGVEVNSSFYRSHRISTWARWSDSVPENFRFSVKIPKAITHERKLIECDDLMAKFLGEVSALGHKLAVLLIQLPPRLSFQASLVSDFFKMLSSRTAVRLACEPRHLSWFGEDADRLLKSFKIARVAADPALTPEAGRPAGWQGLSYWRLHGSPVMYRSAYGTERLSEYSQLVREERKAGHSVWCIFDNTASFAATSDALAILARANPKIAN